MSIPQNKEETIQQIEALVSAFQSQIDAFKNSQYSEAQLRIDFLNPLLKALAWDVDNEQEKSQFLRDVIQEESIDVEDGDSRKKKKLDYILRVGGHRKLFIEAKKPSINIETSKETAFQIRRYGWNANLGISILTNFETLVVYDCRYKPLKEDVSIVARYKIFRFEDYISRINELIELLGFESVNSGHIDEYFKLTENETTPFDSYFLSQIENWRKILASNIQKNNKDNDLIDGETINFVSQRLLNRIIFLRICEDREIEKYEILKKISNYEQLKILFRQSDLKYNSNLFDFIDDNLSMNINIDEQILIDIFKELYYPISSYDFSVIDPLILSQIYEKYLGSKIFISSPSTIEIIQEPEVVASDGVVPTPKLIANEIVTETLQTLLEGKSSDEIKDIKIADICCGSGTFLITLYDHLIKENLNILLEQDITDDTLIYEKQHGIKYLTLNKKREILTKNIFGVDINPYAVEVTRFSLLLKLLEDEHNVTINNYLRIHQTKVLPDLSQNIKFGNSLIDNRFYNYDTLAINNDDLLYKINPFNWEDEFPFLKQKKGFDAIIGNPPYIRIQNLVKHFPEEINYYRSSFSSYSVGKKDIFDKYYLFIEKAIELINPNGIIGYIIPHKFFVIKGGKKLRSSITSQCNFYKIVHFGVTQVFLGRQTYTAIVIFGKQKKDKFTFKRITNLINKSSFDLANTNEYMQNKYSDSPWLFLTKKAELLFEKIKLKNVIPLKNIAKILVGLQTSCDKVYIVHLIKDNGRTVTVSNDDKPNAIVFKIEKEILLPCLYDLQLDLFDTPKPNSYIIFPYLINRDQVSVYSESQMKKNFHYVGNI